MRSLISPSLTLLVAHAPSPSTPAVPTDRPSAVRSKAARSKTKMVDFEERASRELAAYFASVHGTGPRSGDSAEVETILGEVSAYHRGVIALYHDARVWPEPVKKALGAYTALAVRLYCADHPASGPTQALEASAADRLAEIAAADGAVSLPLMDLENRAYHHYTKALRARERAATAQSPATSR
jgi:hypothetical protein